MEIVVLDGYTENPGDLSWDAVKSFGTLTVYDRTPADDAIICKRIGNADIVITNKTPISAYVIASCPSIKFISVLATGYNVVDTHAAAKAGALEAKSDNVPPLFRRYVFVGKEVKL